MSIVFVHDVHVYNTLFVTYSVANQHHLNALLDQLLKQDNLLPSWKDVILPFITKISEKVY